MTAIHMSPFSPCSVSTPLSDVAVAVADPAAVAVVLAPVSVLEANPELVLVLVLVALLATTSAPVVAERTALVVSDAARELDPIVVVPLAVAVLLSISTMDRTQLAASSVDFWK